MEIHGASVCYRYGRMKLNGKFLALAAIPLGGLWLAVAWATGMGF